MGMTVKSAARPILASVSTPVVVATRTGDASAHTVAVGVAGARRAACVGYVSAWLHREGAGAPFLAACRGVARNGSAGGWPFLPTTRMLAVERSAASRPTSDASRAGWATLRGERESGAQPLSAGAQAGGIRWCGMRRGALRRADSTPPREGNAPFFKGMSEAARPGRRGRTPHGRSAGPSPGTRRRTGGSSARGATLDKSGRRGAAGDRRQGTSKCNQADTYPPSPGRQEARGGAGTLSYLPSALP